MTWGEIQIESLKKMFLNKDDLKAEELEIYKQDKKYKTYLFGMKQACNEALIQISSILKPEIYVHNLINENKNLYDLALIIEDYGNLVDIDVPSNVSWSMKTKSCLQINNWKDGEINIYYEKKIGFIDEETKKEDKINLPEESARLIPLYIAGALYKDDDLTMATMYLNEFNNMLNILANKNDYVTNNKITSIYRME